MKDLDLTPETIRAARARSGLSLAEIARELEINPGTWWSWEQGRKRPTGLYRRMVAQWIDAQGRNE